MNPLPFPLLHLLLPLQYRYRHDTVSERPSQETQPKESFIPKDFKIRIHPRTKELQLKVSKPGYDEAEEGAEDRAEMARDVEDEIEEQALRSVAEAVRRAPGHSYFGKVRPSKRHTTLLAEFKTPRKGLKTPKCCNILKQAVFKRLKTPKS